MKKRPNSYLWISLVNFALAILFAIVLAMQIGCSGRDPFHKVVTVPAMRVHIVSDASQYDHAPYRDSIKPIAGYAKKYPPEIWILGKKENGKYRTRALIIGHELQHILGFMDGEVLDPHDHGFWMDE